MNIKAQLLPATVVMAVTAAGIWLVRSEGERYRATIRDSAREAVTEGLTVAAERAVDRAGDEAEELLDQAVAGAERVIDKTASVPGEILRDVTGQDAPPKADPRAENVTPTADSPPTAPPVNTNVPDNHRAAGHGGVDAAAQRRDVDVEPPSTTAPAPSAGAPSPSREEPDQAAEADKPAGVSLPHGARLPTSDEVIRGVFRTGQQITRAADDIGQQYFKLTPEEERRFGRQVHELIKRDYRVLKSPTWARRLRQLAAPLLPDRRRARGRYTITVLNDDDINAFAHLGGYIYLNKGLLDAAQTDVGLQFVLAHEMAHVELDHCVQLLTYAARASEVAGEPGAAIVNLAYQGIAMGYNEEKELEADTWALRKMLALGHSREEALSFLRLLAAREDAHPVRRPASDSPLDTVVGELEDHFRSHPPWRLRIERLENLRIP